MNKAERQEITKRKHKQRCKLYGLKPEEHYELKAQAVVCSCPMCSEKFNRKIKHKSKLYVED